MQIKSLIKYLVPTVFYGLLIIFFVLYLRTLDFSKLANIDLSWWFLGISLVLGLVFRFWGVYIWFVILSGLGAQNLRNSWAELTQVYSKAWMGRYIPGTAPWILGKIYFASKYGISKVKLGISSLLEGGLQIVVIMIVASLMLAIDPRLDVISWEMRLAIIGIIIIGIITLLPPVFNFFIKLVYKVLRKKAFPAEHAVTKGVIAKGALLYAVGALITGLSLFFIAKAVYPELGYDQLFFVMGVGNLAGALGMLVIFAPSGIGVREGVQLVLLSLIMPPEIALAVTVLTRLWGVVMDLAFLGLGIATKALFRNRS